MFSLLYGFWQALFRKVEFHILILGLDRAGKTSLLEQLKGIFTGMEPLPPGKIPPTVGLNIGRMQIKGRKVLFWDLGGQTGLRAIWEKYYAEAHGLVYVVDAAEPERFDESRGVLQTLMANPEVAGAPLLLLANKQDAEGALPAHEVEARLELPQLLLQVQPQALQHSRRWHCWARPNRRPWPPGVQRQARPRSCYPLCRLRRAAQRARRARDATRRH